MVYPVCRSDVCNVLLRINTDKLLQIVTEWAQSGHRVGNEWALRVGTEWALTVLQLVR